jgi:hypothetical protein
MWNVGWFGSSRVNHFPILFLCIWCLFVVLFFYWVVVWTQSSLVGSLYFLTDETVCILLIKMNVILVVVDIQDIHENKSMTWNLQKMLTIVVDLFDHKWLIIWSLHMNTHIVPLYMVSFKLKRRWHNKFMHLYIFTFLDEGTKFLIFTSLHSLVDLYFQRTKFKLRMY